MAFTCRTVPRMNRLRILAALLLSAATGCAGGGTAPGNPALPLRAASHVRWIPAAGISYQIQYAGSFDPRVKAGVYDLDGFDTKASTVAAIHARGLHAVCYVDVGTWENWRPDASKFPASVLGKPDAGWAGERWLDIRQTSVLEPIMAARFAMCASKGFDAVDPDNLDGYTNDTGFPLTGREQLVYDRWVAAAVHRLGLAVAQKNDPGQIAQLSNDFDFAVVEQCSVQGWCKQFAPYTARHRLVVDVEYGISQARFRSKTCSADAALHETAILKRLALGAWIVTCPAVDPPSFR
jgi:hypothetical protein